jgi:allantoin racemase
MRLLIVNPNTSRAMTASIAAAARAVASPGTEIVALQPRFGPRSIEGHFEETIAAAGVADALRQAPAHDAVVIACFGDPGLDAAREVTTAPVLGIAEAACHAAALLATGFSIVTTLSRTCVIAERLVQRYGFTQACRGIHGTDIPVLALEHDGDAAMGPLEAAARQALQQDRSGAIVLGCAGMAPLCAHLQQRLGVPVIDGVAVAVKFAEALASLGLGTSKRGDYAPPLPKVYEGWAAPLGSPPAAAGG